MCWILNFPDSLSYDKVIAKQGFFYKEKKERRKQLYISKIEQGQSLVILPKVLTILVVWATFKTTKFLYKENDLVFFLAFSTIQWKNNFFHWLTTSVNLAQHMMKTISKPWKAVIKNEENGESVCDSCGVESLYSRQANAPPKTKHNRHSNHQ